MVVQAPPNISVLTYCMARGRHAALMVPYTVALLHDRDEMVFVDYSCPEDSGRAVKAACPNVRVVWVPGLTYWHPTHARNCAATAARNDIFIFVDVDNLMAKALFDYCRRLQHGQFFALPPAPGKSGFMAIRRADFFKVNGYEEALIGPSYDDTSMYRALDCAGISRVDIKAHDCDVELIEAENQRRMLEPMNGDTWRQNQDITTILRERHPYRNNVGRNNWGGGWRICP